MAYLKRLFRWLFSWRMLACAAVLLACAAVWFLGPLFVFGELHPFAGVVIRSIAIALLLGLLVLWLMRLPLSPVWVIALCVALWHVGPLFGFGEHRPLAPIAVRVLLVVAILLCYAVYGLYKLWHALRSNDALLKRFLEPSGDRPVEAGHDEARAVAMVVSKAVAQLKRLRGGTFGWRRLLEVDRHLYGLPWYMMLGTPGAGKTTAILGSGLQFPLTGQMGARSVNGIERTANCEWWFANEAVLIDTAGRYVEQDDAQDETGKTVNAAEWKELLGQLRKHRPRAPLNGAILTVSVADLVNRSDAERTALAASLRARLGELRQQLGIRFPVYVFVTKLDLLPGFTEYFQSLTADARTQIWGFTLPCDESGAPVVDGLRRHCLRELTLLEARIDAGLNNRLLEEYEGERRKRLYPLAQEFRSLSAPLADLLELVFLDSRYDDAQLQNMLRGVYFTSAEQTDAIVAADRDTVLQRLTRKLARPRAGSGASAQLRCDGAMSGHRSFFLRNVFQHVIVPEAHLVRADLKWEIRFRAMRVACHLLSVALFMWLAFSLTVSYENNRHYLAAISGKTSALAARAAAYGKAPKAAAIGGLLDGSADLPRHGDLDLDAPGGAYRYGLYVVPAIVTASDTTYLSLLKQTLLPQIVTRVERELSAQIAAQDSDDVYRTLTVYLMLYDAEHYDANAVRAWVLRDWERSDSAAPMGGRNAMARHLDALFGNARPITPTVGLNAALVQQARLFLSGIRAETALRAGDRRDGERGARQFHARAGARAAGRVAFQAGGGLALRTGRAGALHVRRLPHAVQPAPARIPRARTERRRLGHGACRQARRPGRVDTADARRDGEVVACRRDSSSVSDRLRQLLAAVSRRHSAGDRRREWPRRHTDARSGDVARARGAGLAAGEARTRGGSRNLAVDRRCAGLVVAERSRVDGGRPPVRGREKRGHRRSEACRAAARTADGKGIRRQPLRCAA